MAKPKSNLPQKLAKQQFVDRYATTGNAIESYLATYPEKAKENSRSGAANLLRSPYMREAVLAKAGLTDGKLGILLKLVLERLKALLHAKETKFFPYMGKVGEERQVDDHPAQIRACQLLAEIAGCVGAVRRDGRGGDTQIQIAIAVPWAGGDRTNAT